MTAWVIKGHNSHCYQNKEDENLNINLQVIFVNVPSASIMLTIVSETKHLSAKEHSAVKKKLSLPSRATPSFGTLNENSVPSAVTVTEDEGRS